MDIVVRQSPVDYVRQPVPVWRSVKFLLSTMKDGSMVDVPTTATYNLNPKLQPNGKPLQRVYGGDYNEARDEGMRGNY